MMKTPLANQELHLCPSGPAGPGSSPLRLPSRPVPLAPSPDTPVSSAPARPDLTARDAVVEPIFNRQQQLRLFVQFPPATAPHVNGEPAPSLVVLSPGDHFLWATSPGYRVAVFNRPHIGAPPPSLVGQPCPVCRVPFAPASRCVLCSCGVALHCEGDDPGGLQCAQLRRSCPICRRAVVLTEGYLDSPDHED